MEYISIGILDAPSQAVNYDLQDNFRPRHLPTSRPVARLRVAAPEQDVGPPEALHAVWGAAVVQHCPQGVEADPYGPQLLITDSVAIAGKASQQQRDVPSAGRRRPRGRVIRTVKRGGDGLGG